MMLQNKILFYNSFFEFENKNKQMKMKLSMNKKMKHVKPFGSILMWKFPKMSETKTFEHVLIITKKSAVYRCEPVNPKAN